MRALNVGAQFCRAPAEPKERQPQPGEWWDVKESAHPVFYIGKNVGGLDVWQTGDGREYLWCDEACIAIRHLPDCTGFDYKIPPEETPAEKRLREVGITWDTDGDYWTSDGCGLLLVASNFTPDQLKAIVAHMQEQEGGAE